MNTSNERASIRRGEEEYVSNAVSFAGQLEAFRLIELFQMIGLGSNTGALHLRQYDGHAGLVYFDAGALVGCVELDTEALTLGHVLQQLDLASATQIEHAFQLQMHDPLGKRIGERLVDLNIITRDQLLHALTTQTLWTVRELALWQEGTYEFRRDERMPADYDNVRIDITRASMEVLRYEHEWENLQSCLPNGMRTHLAMAFEPPLGHALSFHAAAWRVMSRVNAHRTVRRIATSLHYPEVEVARMIGPLVREGLLVPGGAAGRPGLPEEAERLSMSHFELFTLELSFEQDWLKRKSPVDKLTALASYTNQMMSALDVACRASSLELASDTLTSLLARENLLHMGEYDLRIEDNQIDTAHLAAYCRRVFDGATRGSIETTGVFYEMAQKVLIHALSVTFDSINARVASPIERMQNQEAWKTFITFVSGEE